MKTLNLTSDYSYIASITEIYPGLFHDCHFPFSFVRDQNRLEFAMELKSENQGPDLCAYPRMIQISAVRLVGLFARGMTSVLTHVFTVYCNLFKFRYAVKM